MKFQMPSVKEWNEIEAEYPAEVLRTNNMDFDFLLNRGSFERFADSVNLSAWTNFLSNRLIRTRWSYVIMMFHFKKGIPDEEWVISPGRQGQSAEFFPHFNDDDHMRKAQFDYFADIFYFKLYSCLDTIGHLLQLVYDLKIHKPDFHRSVEKLELVRAELYAKLKAIEDSDDFQNLRALRHGVTHNELPGHIGGMITRVKPNEFAIGTGRYTTSATVVNSARNSLQVLAEVITAVREQIAFDRISTDPESEA